MPGPLGTDTNSPVIDEGTLALTRTRTPGPIGTNADKTLGLLAHAQLCLDAASGAALGLIGAKLWARDPARFKSGPAGARNRKPIEEKESHRWLEGYQAAQRLAEDLGPAVNVTSVADREGDIYEVFAEGQRAHARGGAIAHLLIRAQHNRALNAGEQRSHDQVRDLPAQTHVTAKPEGQSLP